MKKVYDRYFDQMSLEETLPGKYRFHVKGLSDELTSRGLKGLTSAILGEHSKDVNQMAKRLTSVMKLGLLSGETRSMIGLSKNGIGSNGWDYVVGGLR